MAVDPALARIAIKFYINTLNFWKALKTFF
jgi:hypothetical protein